MKKFTLFLATMLFALATNLYAEEVTFTFDDLKGQGASGSGAAFTGATQKDITMGGKGNGNTSYVQIYANGTLTFTPANDATITKIELTATTNTYARTWKASVGTVSVSNTTITWTGSAASTVTLTNTASAQARITKMLVTYTLPAAPVATPVFDVLNNDNNEIANNGFYANSIMLDITCATDGATIHYTLDGSEPTEESATYTTDMLEFTNEFVTIRAKAFKGTDASYEATGNYYHRSSAELPYTTEQAITLYNALGDGTEIFVEGSVKDDVTYDSSTSTANYTITNNATPETTLYIYKGGNETTSGLTDLANLVQGDKVVVKGTLKAYNGNPQLQNSTIVKWAENIYPILTADKEVAFGNISSLAASAPTKTLTVTAKNLTADIVATLSDGAAFTLDKTTLPAEGGELVITPELTIGENTATLTLTSGETSINVALSASIKQAYTIAWNVNGETYTTGEPTTTVIAGEKVTVLPTAPANNTLSCSNVFAGWSTTNIGSKAGEAQPEDLFISAAAAPAVTENTTYYAVFATADGEVKTYLNETFDDYTSVGGNDGQWANSGTQAITDNPRWTFVKGYPANKCVKLGGGSDQGKATTPALGIEGSAVLTFRAGAWQNDKEQTTLKVSISAGSLSAETVTLEKGKFNNYSIDITNGTAESTITFEGATTKNSRFFLDDVVVKTNATMKDYRTNCDGISTEIENATVAEKAVKMIENGQLVIIREGVKYNAQGVRLQ